MAATTQLQTGKLPARRISAVKQRAHELGLTPQQYLQRLIDDDLAVSATARSTSLRDLAAPFREALGNVSERELDRRVKAARASRRNRSAAQRR
jgi:hypothetical protein